MARELLYPRLGLAEADAHYLHRAGDAVAYTELHRGSLAVLTAPIDEATVAGASRQGLCFPQKTTYYFPKPRAGLVLRPLDGQPK